MNSDRIGVVAYAKRDFPEMIRAVENFAKAFEKHWMTENKPRCFDFHDIRLGGLLRRFEYCRKTLNLYFCLKIDSISEFEEVILLFCTKGVSIAFNNALKNMSPSVLYIPEMY